MREDRGMYAGWVERGFELVEEAFADQKIEVLSVNTLNVRGKHRLRSRGRTRVVGKSPDWKKAIVTLAPGQKIEGLFEGI